MKTKFIFILVLTVISFVSAQGQDLPPKHRGLHPRLQKDGKVVDEKGKQLGYITKDGKVQV